MHVAIVGNGITGASAARRVRDRRPDWRITMISGESTYPYSRPALMYIFMGHMRYQDTKLFDDHYWTKHRIDLVRDWVTSIDTAAKTLHLQHGGSLGYDRLLIATGSTSNKFGWPGQDLDGVQGLWDLPDLRLLDANAKDCRHAVIVGGGLIGIELAEMLHARNIHVTFLVRESSYWNNILPAEESAMINRIIRQAGMDLRLETELDEIEDDGTGRVGAVVTKTGERLACELVGLTPGVSPNVELATRAGVDVGRGVLVDWTLKTSTPDVFAAGDCAELVTSGDERNVIQQVWYTGKMQGRTVGDTIAGFPTLYDPGIWYNSAKFLDLEYQTYGKVNMRVPGERTYYWECSRREHALRLVTVDDAIIGVNSMGLRLRHDVCERWIADAVSFETAVGHLEDANFDPEFTRRYSSEITTALRRQRGEGTVHA